MSNIDLTGTFTAIITPFTKDGKNIDYTAFENLIEEQISAGIDGIVVAGTTGESPTLTWAENDELIKKAVEMVHKRILVIAGTGSNSTAEAVIHSVEAEKNGADALLVVTPYYNKPTQNGIYDYFMQVNNAINIPIIVYNIAGRCGVNIETKTLLRMRDTLQNIKAVKEASGSFEQAQEVRKMLGEDFPILCGEESLTYKLIKERCGNGVVSVMANSHPAEIKKLVELGRAGNFEEGDALQAELLEKMNACFIETNPIPIKTLLAKMGKCELSFRSPLVEMEEKNEKKLLNTFGL
ncbi:TPA: 4-hydroxy-tetrahydrodipicolinate synthase [Candidatus Gracilibacteria bacterium]|nr:4-hydroxy-tetrahydrodipicolinate synthase [Candidatus Peregrinibacteria bacterium]HIQ56515.1 4-hydroxy-tetrahydrodipicolinate synthase [Candidatus Gracilibacteria bacterium]HIQ57473.1 4-hydroxy-tetrahydrodipicolinate synthase [Candidatus Gracilibacteria bacterium]